VSDIYPIKLPVQAPGFIGDGSQLTIENEKGNLKEVLSRKLNKTGDGSQLKIDGEMGNLKQALDSKLNKTKTVWTSTKRFSFAKSIVTNSRTWQELTHYRTEVKTPALSGLSITLHIPFVASDTDSSRSRILLYFDNDYISDATKYTRFKWEMHEITLTGLVENVTAATHKIRLCAAIDKGSLKIPHYNPRFIEHTLKPSIFANLNLIGFY
jgi:hypothetical protein